MPALVEAVVPNYRLFINSFSFSLPLSFLSPSLTPSLQVCEEYRLHRETYYLAVDMYDRFMDTQINVQKEQLQLVGVTCLFMASKIEEIYPPKLADFAYVTDGACLADEIISTELVICKVRVGVVREQVERGKSQIVYC